MMDVKGLLNSPLLGLGLGLLQGAQPGGTFAGGLNSGYQNMLARQKSGQAADFQKLQMAQMKQAIEAKKVEQDRANKQRAAMSKVIGNIGAESPVFKSGSSQATGLMASNPQLAGLLGSMNPADAAKTYISSIGKNGETSLQKNLLASGLAPGTPEYQAAISQYLNKPAANINLSQSKPVNPTDASRYRIPTPAGGWVMPKPGMTPGQIGKAGGRFVDKTTPEQASKISMLQVAQNQFGNIKELLFDGEGEIDRTNVFNSMAGTPLTEGRDLGTYIETGIQAITRGETGAAMPPQEVSNTRKRFQPSVLDSDILIKAKLGMYEDTINGTLNLIDKSKGEGNWKLDGKKFDEALKRRVNEIESDGAWEIVE